MRYAELDAQGIVYHAHYLVYAEVAQHAYQRQLDFDGLGLDALGVTFTTVAASVRYRAPLHQNDEYAVRSRVSEVRRSSWVFEHRVERADGTECARVETVMVQIEIASRRATPLVQPLREKLLAARGVSSP